MENISNLRIFTTTMQDGIMEYKSYIKDYRSKEFSKKSSEEKRKEQQELKKAFKDRRIKVGNDYGFDGKKIIIPSDNTIGYTPGSYFIADEKLYSQKEDLSELKIPGDIVLLKRDNPGIVIGYPVSDDPVIIIEDQKNDICALAHCNLEKISARIPVLAINALKQEAGSNVKNLKVYISPHLKKANNVSFIKPNAIKNNSKIWKDCIKRKIPEDTNMSSIRFLLQCFAYQIDQEKAIIDMLAKSGINKNNIIASKEDTYSSDKYYSSKKQEDLKEPILQGKFLVGAYYDDTFQGYEASPHRVKSL